MSKGIQLWKILPRKHTHYSRDHLHRQIQTAITVGLKTFAGQIKVMGVLYHNRSGSDSDKWFMSITGGCISNRQWWWYTLTSVHVITGGDVFISLVVYNIGRWWWIHFTVGSNRLWWPFADGILNVIKLTHLTKTQSTYKQNRNSWTSPQWNILLQVHI